MRADGTYTITGREHVGLFDLEAGGWKQRGHRLTFTPSRKLSGGRMTRGGTRYVATEVTHGTHTFLAFEDEEHAPALVIPIAETVEELKRLPDRRPSYVFFEIDRTTFDDETEKSYPFRTLQPK